MKKVSIAIIDYDEQAECPKCSTMTEMHNDGHYCLKCQDILFNVCEFCKDGTLLHLKAWGLTHLDADSDNFDDELENYKHRHEDNENPKYFATEDDDEALTDHSMYLWWCPQCKKETTTIAD